MQDNQREIKRLKQAQVSVNSYLSGFGVNNKQETTRLLYEISKRENIPPTRIIQRSFFGGYREIKRLLLARRYPVSFSSGEEARVYLPKLSLAQQSFFNPKKSTFSPTEIFIEKKAVKSVLAKRLKLFFPEARFKEIRSHKSYCCQQRGQSTSDYNRRKRQLFLVAENYDFFKCCPCTRGALGCGYHVFNLGFGCIYDCTYCFLQAYSNSPGIILSANLSNFFDRFNFYRRNGMRVGTGGFFDSLALDELTEYSLPIIDFFRKYQRITFEFKTKSANVKNLFKARHGGNIVVSWSLNPQTVIDNNEYFTAPLKSRINAALDCIRHGYRIGMHFDPIIYYANWQEEYAALVERLFERIKPRDIAWISMGTFRFNPALKQFIEKRFPGNKILNEELLLGYDNKLRYSFEIRYNIYKKMFQMLRSHSRSLKLYLCMEERAMWKKLRMQMPCF